MGLLDCAVAWQACTARGATLLHTQPFTQAMLQHSTQLLQEVLAAPLKRWGAAVLSPGEQSAVRRAGLQTPPTPGALGATVASLAGCAAALNRLPSIPASALDVYRHLDACAHKLLAPSSRSAAAVQAWRNTIVCSDEVFSHITSLVHALVASGTWSDATLRAYAECLALRCDACPPHASAAHAAPALALGAHALCAARCVDALSRDQWRQLAGLFLDEEAALHEGGDAAKSTPPPPTAASLLGSRASQLAAADVWDVDVPAGSEAAPRDEAPALPPGVFTAPEVLAPLQDATLARAPPLPDISLVLTGTPAAQLPTAAPLGALYALKPKASLGGISTSTTKGVHGGWIPPASTVLQLLLARGVLPRERMGSATAEQVRRMAGAAVAARMRDVSASQCDQLRQAMHRARLPPPQCGQLAEPHGSDGAASTPPAKQALSASAAVRRLQAAVMPRGARRPAAAATGDERTPPPHGMHGVPLVAGWHTPVPAALLARHATSGTQRRVPLGTDIRWVSLHSPLHQEMQRVGAHEAAASSVAKLSAGATGGALPLTAGVASWGVPLAALVGSPACALSKRPSKRRLATGRGDTPALQGQGATPAAAPQALVSVAAAPDGSAAGADTSTALAAGGPSAVAAADASLPSVAAGGLQQLLQCLPPAAAAQVSSSGLEAAEVAFLAARARLANTAQRLHMDTLLAAGVTPVVLPLDEWRSISAARRAVYLRTLLP